MHVCICVCMFMYACYPKNAAFPTLPCSGETHYGPAINAYKYIYIQYGIQYAGVCVCVFIHVVVIVVVVVQLCIIKYFMRL